MLASAGPPYTAALVDRAAEPEGVASLVFGQAVVLSDLAPSPLLARWRPQPLRRRPRLCLRDEIGSSTSQRHAIRNDCHRRPVSMGPNDLLVLHETQFAPWLDQARMATSV